MKENKPPPLPWTHQKHTVVIIALILTVLTVYTATELYSKGGSWHWPFFYEAGGSLIPAAAAIFFTIYFKWTKLFLEGVNTLNLYILGVIGIFTSLWWAPVVLMIGWAAFLMFWILVGAVFS